MFENFVMLAGLGGAVMPLVIHLLSRARYRPVEWGAMMFLQETSAATGHVGRLREWTLLALRMAAIGLLAIALARPVAGQLTAGEAGRAAVAIVVDCSGSMSHQEATSTRMAMAREAALRVLATLRRGDQVCLIAAGTNAATPAFTGDLQAVATRVNELRAVSATIDLARVLAGAAEQVAQQESTAGTIYLICDRQSANWGAITEDDDVAARVRNAISEARARVVVIPVGSEDAENVAVESVEMADGPATGGGRVTMEVSVRNFGKSPRTGVPLSVRYRGREVLATTVNIAPQQNAVVRVPIEAGPAGTYVLTAELPGDASETDDRLETIVEVMAPIRTLIVRGDEIAGETNYAAAALAPHRAAGIAGADPANVDVTSYAQWAAETLANYQVLVLDDVAALSGKEARAVEQFVYSGGGLLLAPGPSAKIEEYNRQMYREDSGLLPALLQPAAATPTPVRIDAASLDASHPITRMLAGEAGPLPGVARQYFPMTARTAAAHVPASFSSGDPFIMESSFGAGRVVLMTCGLDARWSTLPLTSVYLPLLQSSIRHLASSTPAERNLRAGEEIVATFSPAVEQNRVIVIHPDGTRDSGEVAQIEQRSEVRYAATNVAGVYSVRAGEQAAPFAVAPPAEESNLEPLTAGQWAELSRRVGFVREEREQRAARVQESDADRGWMIGLVGVLMLLVGEMFVTRRWTGEPA